MTISATPGECMSPVPRRIEASVLASQCAPQPRNITVEKATAPSSAAPLPPSAPNSGRPKPTNTTANSTVMAAAMASAWAAASSALPRSPEPSARATDEATPPPMAPADIICNVVCAGKTRASAASSAVPSWPTNQPSAISTRLCAETLRTLGAARVRIVGTSGPASIA